MHEPVALHRVELPAEAMAVWRTSASHRPTLLLLAGSPLTLPVPTVLRPEIDALALAGTAAELARRSDPNRSDLFLLPDMLLDPPLRLGWFKQIVWAVPVADPENPPIGAVLREQMQGAGLLSADEAASLVGEKLPLHMRLRGVPAKFAPLDELPAIDGPVVLHVDLSYFQGLYKSEIATPVLGLVARTLTTLRQRNIPVLAATFSYGNLDGRISLDVRFQGELLAGLLADPRKFDAPPAQHWQQQKDILYLKNFMKNEMVMELAQAQEKVLPEAAWIKFNLFRAAADLNRGSEALEYLAAAVERDKVYALQYLDLASLAFERGRPDEALRMLHLANQAFPENVHIRLQMAQLAGQMGDRKAALHLVEQLQKLPWSPVYYPQMPAYLQGFAEYLQQEPLFDSPSPGPGPKGTPPEVSPKSIPPKSPV